MPQNPFDPAAVDPETARFVAKLEAVLADMPAVNEVPVELSRRARDEGLGPFPFHPPLPEAVEVSIPPAPGGPGKLRILRPEGRPTGVFLHIHGGGWTLGRPWHQDHRLKALINATGCATVSVEYRWGQKTPGPPALKIAPPPRAGCWIMWRQNLAPTASPLAAKVPGHIWPPPPCLR